MNRRALGSIMSTRAQEGWIERLGWRRALVLLWLLSLAIDLAVGFGDTFRHAPSLLDQDEQEYWLISGAITHGSFVLNPRRTFGFPLLLAGLRSISDDILFVQAAVTAIYSLSAPLLALAVRRVTNGRRAALLAGAGLALWPSAIFFGTSLYSESIAAPVLLLTLSQLPAARDRRHGRAFVAGLLLALATHVRPMYLLALPVVWLALAIETRAWRPFLIRSALVTAGFALLVLPWSITMTRAFHTPILISANGGETLAGGLNPVLVANAAPRTLDVPSRRTWVGAGKWIPFTETGYLTPADTKLTYWQLDKVLRARTIAWIRAHPGDAAYLESHKLLYMWGLWPLTEAGTAQLLLGDLPVIALVMLGLVGFVRLGLARWPLARFWLLPFFTSGVALISWGSWRFRQPADAGLLALCAVAAVAGCYARGKRRLEVAAAPADVAVERIRSGADQGVRS